MPVLPAWLSCIVRPLHYVVAFQGTATMDALPMLPSSSLRCCHFGLAMSPTTHPRYRDWEQVHVKTLLNQRLVGKAVTMAWK